MYSTLCKLLQRQTYDVLSHRYGIFVVIVGLFILLISAFQFGEMTIEWSRDKYAAVFNSFSDNILGKSFQKRLCLPVPIDIVYTWVNGTDPRLLAELRKLQHDLEREVNETTTQTPKSEEDRCKFTQCVPAKMIVLHPNLDSGVDAKKLATFHGLFHGSTSVFAANREDVGNNSVVSFKNFDDVNELLKLSSIILNGKNHTIKRAFLTSDWTVRHSFLLHDIIMMSDLQNKYNTEQLREKLPKKYKDSITEVEMVVEKGVSLLYIAKKTDLNTILDDRNFTIDGKQPTMNAANLVWELQTNAVSDDIASHRFEDNEELRYSLRSVEKFAPWVRHIYIVTNGQIPYWLDLENPRISLITHEEIFTNRSHLPTFSSPAIESHIHRIPGLSDKFIYMNDDVLFGKEVWPDDFYTQARGQKVYLTWPVPNCHDGCPANWIRDGYCDKSCNTSDCDWDGGDCLGNKPGTGLIGQHIGAGGFGQNWAHAAQKMYCTSGCANNWLADKYCDQACNVRSCGFDAGDCGTSNFDQLYRANVSTNPTTLIFPPGEMVAVIDLSSLFGTNGTINVGKYNESEMIRSATLTQKHKTFHVLLHENYTDVKLPFEFNGKNEQGKDLVVKLTINANTKVKPATAAPVTKKPTIKIAVKLPVNTSEEFKFTDIPISNRKAQPRSRKAVLDIVPVPADLDSYQLPPTVQQKFNDLRDDLKNDVLTKQGYQKKANELWTLFVSDLKKVGKQPELKPATSKNSTTLVKNSSSKEGNLRDSVAVNDDKFRQYFKDVERNKIKILEQENEVKDEVLRDNADDEKLVESKKAPQQEDVGKLRKGNEVVEAADGLQNRTKDGPVDLPNMKVEKLDSSETQKIDEHVDKAVPRSSNASSVGKASMRKLNSFDESGFLPWERRHVFDQLQQKKELFENRRAAYEMKRVGGRRRLLDTYADSLRHVNKVYNKAFGYTNRKVPAHMPHMIDRHVMTALQKQFAADWAETSSHRVRTSRDMQYSFAYFYFLMSQPKNLTVNKIFRDMDTDHSGVLSDRELRTLATKLYELPLDSTKLTSMESIIKTCSQSQLNQTGRSNYVPSEYREEYYDKNLPQVTLSIVLYCEPLIDLMSKSFLTENQYQYEILDDSENAFKMIHSNVSKVITQLDDIRKNPKKFICLNDNIKHGTEGAQTVKAVLHDFYESLFPVRSQFEIGSSYRNRFLHMDELQQWKRDRKWLRNLMYVAVAFLILVSILTFCNNQVVALKRKIWRSRPNNSVNTTTQRTRGKPLIV
ncbi:N-acetylglucosamine-1-phosphotransferase subunits alpha/beta-like [Tubulanus polymorphus]|uniref:N-acetylglucosamine-1-phosphotransferase subunits alpha/beta-like n=1 Tax=Tubulanus polymorphus TaxID=672921 RepID=UPI003DA4A13B